MSDQPTPDKPRSNRLRFALLAGLVLVYAVLSHYSNSNDTAKGLGAALSVGPLALIGVALVWQWTPRWIAAAITAAIAVLLYRYWSFFESNFEWSDMIQQTGVYALLALGFARSLFGGRVPLCTQLAVQMHGTLEVVELAYTRRATWAWAAFYFALAAAIALLFFLVSQKAWSLFVNFATFALIIVACLVDYGLRRRLLPHRPGGGLLTLLQRSLIG